MAGGFTGGVGVSGLGVGVVGVSGFGSFGVGVSGLGVGVVGGLRVGSTGCVPGGLNLGLILGGVIFGTLNSSRISNSKSSPPSSSASLFNPCSSHPKLSHSETLVKSSPQSLFFFFSDLLISFRLK